MPRTLVVDDDPLGRALLADLLHGLGHSVEVTDSAADALARATAAPFDLVLADAALPGVDGLELAERLARLPQAPGVVLVAVDQPGPVQAAARARGVRLLGVVGRRPDPPTLAALLAGAAAPVEAAHGIGALEAMRGPRERVSPLRLLHLAHRVDASGALVVEADGVAARVVLRAARVVHVEGVPGLLAALDPHLADHRSLPRDIGAAVAAGHPIDRALEVASAALGEWLVRVSQGSGGMVRFEIGASPPPGAFPLPLPTPRLLAAGVRLARPAAEVERHWTALTHARIEARPPDDSPEERWGLDATALRVLRVAQVPREVRGLVSAAGGDDAQRRADVLRALDFLHVIGLLVVDGGALARDATATGGARRPVEPTEEDPRVAQLRAALATMEGAHPVDILELGDARQLSDEGVSQAYRGISRRFHPDGFFNSAPLVRALAEACFARVNGAYEELRAPGGLVEAQRFLAARAAGRGFVTQKDHQAARVAFKKGEVLFRNRDWRGADERFQEALRLDATTWPHAFFAIRAGALSRRLATDAAVKQLDELQCPDVKRRAEVLVAIGNVLKLDGRAADALRRYRQAAELDPENHDAARELRLHQARAERPAEPPSVAQSAAERITGFFRRATDKR